MDYRFLPAAGHLRKLKDDTAGAARGLAAGGGGAVKIAVRIKNQAAERGPAVARAGEGMEHRFLPTGGGGREFKDYSATIRSTVGGGEVAAGGGGAVEV